MNKLLSSFFCLFFLAFSFIPEKESPIALQIEEITSFFGSGSSKGLAQFFENGLELNVKGDKGTFSKIQAELVLRDFFKKHPAKDFQIIHSSGKDDQIQYYIGNYQSTNSQFRILIKIKSNKDALRIFSLEIIPSDDVF